MSGTSGQVGPQRVTVWRAAGLCARIRAGSGRPAGIDAVSRHSPTRGEGILTRSFTTGISSQAYASVVAPAVDTFTRNSAKGLSPDALRETLLATIEEAMRLARATSQGKVGPAFFGPMRLDELMLTRIIETGVHGLDLSAALGKAPHLTARARQSCVAQLEELLQHRRGIERPADLGDDIAFIEVATGRRPYADARFPVLQ